MSLPKKRWPDFDRSARLKDYAICKNGEPLTANQYSVFFDRIGELQPDKVYKVYRGNDRTRLLPQYGLSPNSIPQPFNDFLFLYGEKGRYFVEKMNEKIGMARKKFTIEDVSNDFFRAIFDMISSALKTSHGPAVQARIDTFKAEQKAVTSFFLEPRHKDKLVATVMDLTDRDKIRVRDYYLTLLHHLDKSSYYPVSFLLSTTKSFKIAQQFSERAFQRGEELILFGWVPLRSESILATPRFAPGKGNLLFKLGLPMYDKSFFPNQQEITIKGGLFPDYIYGYLYSKSGSPIFEVNPYILTDLDKNWVEQGFPIDRKEFWKNFGQTRFSTAFVLMEETGTYFSI